MSGGHPATVEHLEAEASALEAQAAEARGKVDQARQRALEAQPLVERLTFAAYERCACGAGMAYDPAGKVRSPGDSPLRTPNAWECSTILRYYGGDLSEEDAEEAKAVTHSAALPFAFYEVKSENQPSVSGATTRAPKVA